MVHVYTCIMYGASLRGTTVLWNHMVYAYTVHAPAPASLALRSLRCHDDDHLAVQGPDSPSTPCDM